MATTSRRTSSRTQVTSFTPGLTSSRSSITPPSPLVSPRTSEGTSPGIVMSSPSSIISSSTTVMTTPASVLTTPTHVMTTPASVMTTPASVMTTPGSVMTPSGTMSLFSKLSPSSSRATSASWHHSSSPTPRRPATIFPSRASQRTSSVTESSSQSTASAGPPVSTSSSSSEQGTSSQPVVGGGGGGLGRAAVVGIVVGVVVLVLVVGALLWLLWRRYKRGNPLLRVTYPGRKQKYSGVSGASSVTDTMYLSNDMYLHNPHIYEPISPPNNTDTHVNSANGHPSGGRKLSVIPSLLAHEDAVFYITSQSSSENRTGKRGSVSGPMCVENNNDVKKRNFVELRVDTSIDPDDGNSPGPKSTRSGSSFFTLEIPESSQDLWRDVLSAIENRMDGVPPSPSNPSRDTPSDMAFTNAAFVDNDEGTPCERTPNGVTENSVLDSVRTPNGRALATQVKPMELGGSSVKDENLKPGLNELTTTTLNNGVLQAGNDDSGDVRDDVSGAWSDSVVEM